MLFIVLIVRVVIYGCRVRHKGQATSSAVFVTGDVLVPNIARLWDNGDNH